MPEKASKQILPMLHGAGSAARSVSQRVKVKGGIVRQGIGFEVGPQVFDGIELGSVRKKVFQMCRTRQHTFVDEPALVRLEAIPDQHDGCVQLMLKVLEEIHCALGVDVGIRMEPKVQRYSIPFGRDAYCGDGRNLLKRTAALAQYRCVPTQAPGTAHQGSHEHPGFVERASRSSLQVSWITGADATVGYLARIDGKYIFTQFYVGGPRAGELATAFVPDQTQLSRIFQLLGFYD